MPLLRIQTNAQLEKSTLQSLLRSASQLVSAQLGKPEQYVMVAIESNPNMLFGGTSEPLAYLELKSIGLPDEATGGLSKALCGLLQEALSISQERVYVEFSNAPRHLWGWNGATF